MQDAYGKGMTKCTDSISTRKIAYKDWNESAEPSGNKMQHSLLSEFTKSCKIYEHSKKLPKNYLQQTQACAPPTQPFITHLYRCIWRSCQRFWAKGDLKVTFFSKKLMEFLKSGCFCWWSLNLGKHYIVELGNLSHIIHRVSVHFNSVHPRWCRISVTISLNCGRLLFWKPHLQTDVLISGSKTFW